MFSYFCSVCIKRICCSFCHRRILKVILQSHGQIFVIFLELFEVFYLVKYLQQSEGKNNPIELMAFSSSLYTEPSKFGKMQFWSHSKKSFGWRGQLFHHGGSSRPMLYTWLIITTSPYTQSFLYWSQKIFVDLLEKFPEKQSKFKIGSKFCKFVSEIL